MDHLPKNCRDCGFRAKPTDPFGCAYALMTGRTRQGQNPGEKCTRKIKGSRFTAAPMAPEVRKEVKLGHIDSDHCMDLYKTGRPDTKIAEEFGVTPTAVRRWRKKQGLPPNGAPGRKRA